MAKSSNVTSINQDVPEEAKERKTRKRPEFHALTSNERSIISNALTAFSIQMDVDCDALGDVSANPSLTRLRDGLIRQKNDANAVRDLLEDARLIRLSLTNDDGE